MDASNSPRSRGRPRVPDKARKRNNVTIRMRDELKGKVLHSADDQERSISQEIEYRLERSFTDEAAFGGPEMQRLAYHMVAAFALPAYQHASDKANWVHDQAGYRAGVIGVCDALLQGFADEDAARVIEVLKGRLLTRIAQAKGDSQ
jgi:hypothetical protein